MRDQQVEQRGGAQTSASGGEPRVAGESLREHLWARGERESLREQLGVSK